ncbi:MAG: metal ABC transporter permease [Planctomycetota bacterium]
MFIDIWTLAIALVTAISCSLCGGLLIVNRNAMVSEGLSHAVLPGLAIAFWFLRDYSSPWLLISAAACGLLMVWLTEAFVRSGVVESDASLGIVFAGMFSLGVLFASNYLKNTHFHSDCIIEGNLSLAVFDRFELGTLYLGPKPFYVMLGILLLQLAFITICYKELKAMLFDSELASRFGLRPKLFQLLWLSIVSVTTVAAFNVAGSILIVALMIAPPTAAYLITVRLSSLLVLSVVLGCISAVAGFYSALAMDVSTTGPIASAAGLVFLAVLFFAPGRGLLAARFLNARQNRDTLDCLVLQWIQDSKLSSSESAVNQPGQGKDSELSALRWRSTVERLLASNLITRHDQGFSLTGAGEAKLAAKLADFS